MNIYFSLRRKHIVIDLLTLWFPIKPRDDQNVNSVTASYLQYQSISLVILFGN